KHYKKPHYHVIYIARNPVTIESVRNKIKRKLGNSSIAHVEILDYIKGSYEYLTHESKDAIAKKKHIYDKKNILHINDFDLDRYITLDESQKRELKNQLLQIIRKKHLVNVLHLLDFLEKNGSEYGITNLNDVNDVVTSNASGFRLYFDANYQDGFRRERKINRETGEISDDFER
ncbi:replication protein RepB, partial [Enterococcus faecalis]|nr:replication protein RepB [Enterococcus faecalis]